MDFTSDSDSGRKVKKDKRKTTGKITSHTKGKKKKSTEKQKIKYTHIGRERKKRGIRQENYKR